MPQQDYVPRPAAIKWLLDSDPAIRWQVMRDLTDEAPDAIAAERSRTTTVGWGAKLLALQAPAGNWGGPNEDRGLLITLYSLVVFHAGARSEIWRRNSGNQTIKLIDP